MSNAPKRFDPPGTKFTGMSQAIRTGEFVTVSGQVALKGGKVVGINDPKAQAQQCFENINAALAEAGTSLSDVINLRCYLVGSDSYAGYGAVKNELFKDNPPCSTAVIISGLLLPDLLMEVEAIAWKPE